jgi:hypothetical protein
LAFADRYISHICISGLYDKLNLPSKAIYHIEQHVKGYIEWKASIDNKDLSKSKIGELYKDIGKRYLGNIAQYLNFVDEAYVHKALGDEAYKKILFDFNGHILEERAKSRYKLISKI